MKHLTKFEDYLEEKNKGLWANVAAKKKRGEKPAKKGDKNYPDEKAYKSATEKNEVDEAMVQVAGKSKPSGANVLAILIVKYLDDNLIMPSNANKKKITQEIMQLIMDSTF